MKYDYFGFADSIGHHLIGHRLRYTESEPTFNIIQNDKALIIPVKYYRVIGEFCLERSFYWRTTGTRMYGKIKQEDDFDIRAIDFPVQTTELE